MAQFLNHDQLLIHFDRMFKQSEKQLILITPILKFTHKLKHLLEMKNKSQADVRILYGVSRLSTEEVHFLKNLEFIHNNVCTNLHASLFLNENNCIVGGLNLHEFYSPEKAAVGVPT
ncbi:hypothetical protein PQO03_10720 [Lentisphaera profundi]|uniref:PLD phosphodiesterase domain-containing protein n=1 Tax=Lentisphaera profundi TaxID=1658616 RepID=A0ABY7VR47_9BACT|nr:hypothetical protein [Lentisphaera profundi]WDE96184.1 hypothetical protein PQO03_10720 [Lentisphaera profundi]